MVYWLGTPQDLFVTVYVRENQAFVKNTNELYRLSHCVSQKHHRSKFEVNCPFLAGDITAFILAILKRNIRETVF